MSTTIYTSEKVMPYVYMGTHKVTGQFYFGSRTGSKVYIAKGRPSHLDFGIHYFTSSNKVKDLGFENFIWTILVEFFDPKTGGKDAKQFEDDLIIEFWRHPKSLNFGIGGEKFCASGENHPMFGKQHSEEALLKMTEASSGPQKPLQCPYCELIGGYKSMLGNHIPYCENNPDKRERKPRPHDCCPHCGVEGDTNSMKRWHFDNCAVIKPRAATVGKMVKIKCPHCDVEGGASVMKQYHFDNCVVIKPRVFRLEECPHCGKICRPSLLKRWHLDNCKQFKLI